MNRLVLWVVVAFFVGSTLGVHYSQAIAQEDRTIPIRATQTGFTNATGGAGDPCTFRRTPGSMTDRIPHQIEVRNESNILVAVWTIEGTLEPDIDDSLTCIAEYDLPVPAAEFYTVYLNVERVRSYTTADFPIDERELLTVAID